MRGTYVTAGLGAIIVGIMLLVLGIYAFNGFINPLNYTLGNRTETIAIFGQMVGGILILIGVCLGIAGAALQEKIKIQKSTVVTQTKTIQTPSATPDAVNIAMMRYAKGEITKEQYEQIKKDFGADLKEA